LLPNDRLSFAGIPYQVIFGEVAVEGARTEAVHAKELAEVRKMADEHDPERESDTPDDNEGPVVVQNQLPDNL
jgi:hypothetical protein